ncbi:damage-control phosphatase ARMT1 family protein [Sulfurospirillum arcachonense]|uniref:damage-control phosphatase ARMT1 family protein n=1 Tax=Sulfurospirillum arcachonense TaxID=57666 RepID=UPI000468295A|nr:ARMT1-like domain-containing protein [Sulfurospirillum arcachonense]
MKIEKECLECIYNQSTRVSDYLQVNKTQAIHISKIANQHIENFDFNNTPPHNATPMYEEIAKFLELSDLYADMKDEASLSALKFVSTCKDAINMMPDKLEGAIKAAIAGNVIDLAAEVMFDLEDEIAKIFQRDFDINDFELLKEKLQTTKTLVYLADNAGEEVFDKICIETIKELFPDIKVYYFVRGNPIINDLTISHAKKSGLDDVAILVDSGVPTPGYALDLASQDSLELFNSADCIISKGMGNYECLGDKSGFPLYFLLKVKCQVVAREIGANLGDIVCKKL